MTKQANIPADKRRKTSRRTRLMATSLGVSALLAIGGVAWASGLSYSAGNAAAPEARPDSTAGTPAQTDSTQPGTPSSGTAQQGSASPTAAPGTLDPAAGTIVEPSVTIEDSPHPGPAQELRVTLQVKPDGRVTVTDQAQSLTGSGTLVGTTWAWHHWEAQTALREGMTAVSKTDLVDGKYQATKAIYSKTGRLMATVKESLTLVPAAEFEARYRKALAGR